MFITCMWEDSAIGTVQCSLTIFSTEHHLTSLCHSSTPSGQGRHGGEEKMANLSLSVEL
jgi:hypothetical protein